MKVIAILMMVVSVFVILAYGLMFLLGFAMSFDAPSSDIDPKAWLMRIGMFLPIIVGIALLILAIRAMQMGHHGRAVFFSGIMPVAGIVFWGILTAQSFQHLNAYNLEREADAQEAKLHPKQRYIRPSGEGADSIIVWPSRMVAYRYYQGPNLPYYGDQLGTLNESRDTIHLYHTLNARIRPEELDQFVDEQGRRLTEVYVVGKG